jgi:hypothetical protein
VLGQHLRHLPHFRQLGLHHPAFPLRLRGQMT